MNKIILLTGLVWALWSDGVHSDVIMLGTRSPRHHSPTSSYVQ